MTASDDALDRVRETVRASIPRGYEEVQSGKFTVWQVPLSKYPDTYNKQPLQYAALAPQKNYNALYLMSPYGKPALEKRLREGFKSAGKKLDMGKSCIRFKSADDLPLDVIGDIVGAIDPDEWVAIAKAARSAPRKKTASKASKR